jgi:hypothetical protein
MSVLSKSFKEVRDRSVHAGAIEREHERVTTAA